MLPIFNRFHHHGSILLLCLILSAPLACTSSYHTENNHRDEPTLGADTDPIDVARPEFLSERELQQEYLLLQEQNRQLQQLQEDDDYCDLCQGLNLLADKIPTVGSAPCSDLDFYYQFLWPDPTNITLNLAGTCRADLGYNFNSDLCCKASIPKYECEQNVHEFLFGESAPKSYNTAVPPIISVDEPLEVTVQITYQALEHIEVEIGTATIFMDVELRWTDPRLAWDVVDGDTCTNVIDVFTGQEVEKTQIWMPDFDLLNQVEAFQNAPDFKASIFSDGTVSWIVSGGMEAFCAFTGLANIPYDNLGCQLLFGVNTRSYSKLIRYVHAIPDFAGVGAFELAYNEWTVDPAKTRQGTAFDGNVIYYDVFFTRATVHYVQNIVAPTIILTYLSFCTYLLDMRVGERLGFGMALALVIVAQQIITVELSPVSNQLLWMDKFVSWSFYWVVIGVVQSVLLGFLYFVQEDKQEKKEKAEARASMLSQLEENRKREEEAEETVGLAAQEEENDIPENEDDVREQGSSKDRSKYGCLYTMSLRKLDLISLVVAVVTYTIYIIVMFSTLQSGAWLRDEPRWFNESTFVYPVQYYDVNDPNN